MRGGGGNFPGGNCLGEIIRGVIIQKAVVRGVIIRGEAIFLRGNCPRTHNTYEGSISKKVMLLYHFPILIFALSRE